MIKNLNYFLQEDIVEPEEIRELYSGQPDDHLDFLNALITLKRNTRVMDDFYVFNNIVRALNYKKPDFREFEPVNAEEMWNGIHLIHKFFPDIEFRGESVIFIKAVLNEDGIYFYPDFVEETKSLKSIKEKSEIGPFPIQGNSLLEIQAAKYLALDTYHKKEMTRDLSWLQPKSN